MGSSYRIMSRSVYDAAPGAAVVLGYLWTEDPEPGVVESLVRSFGDSCDARGLHVGSVFVDAGIGPDADDRPALLALLELVREPAYHAVVMPGPQLLRLAPSVVGPLTTTLSAADRSLIMLPACPSASRPGRAACADPPPPAA